MSSPNRRSIVFIQYAGDYAEAYRRLCGGGQETYYAQRYSIDALAALVTPTTSVTTICCAADFDEDVVLDNGVRSINIKAQGAVDEQRVWEVARQCEPTHLCLRTPLRIVLRRALADRSVDSVLLTLADSFRKDGLRKRLKTWRLVRLMNHPKVAWVGNHGINSSRSLRRVGVDPSRIIPWDWPHSTTPHQFAPKEPRVGATWRALFAGMLVESKGIGDVMRALRVLKDRGTAVALTYAGRGDAEKFAALATELQIADRVTYLGPVAHSAVMLLMREADLVIVASRHEYPEGFPMTIYEALTSRTPIVASDHPMYGPHLHKAQAALVYPAGDHQALAASIGKLLTDPQLYAAVSKASADAWDKLQLPITWGKLVEGWLSGDAQSELSKHALRSR